MRRGLTSLLVELSDNRVSCTVGTLGVDVAKLAGGIEGSVAAADWEEDGGGETVSDFDLAGLFFRGVEVPILSTAAIVFGRLGEDFEI